MRCSRWYLLQGLAFISAQNTTALPYTVYPPARHWTAAMRKTVLSNRTEIFEIGGVKF